ncbi:MAG TPA: aldehyde dehydrogenase family protein [Actinomycetota bacterium]|nr:aldehyde dehydrogenase family protein [Actinomycetota bacterium]
MSRTIDVVNPRTGRVDHRIAATDPEVLGTLAGEIREEQRQWEASGLDARTGTLLEWADTVHAARAALVEALVADTGRLAESHMEVDAVVGSLRRWAAGAADALGSPERRAASVPGVAVEQAVRPYPLVGVISPWNFPLLLSTIDAIPALVAGCAVIVKPSEIAPRFVEPLRETVPDALPLALVTGDSETGAALVETVDAICFTGSVATGRKVAEQAARRFIPAFCELGGKDPAVVLSSADLDRATSAVLWGATANAGQSCQSIERVYVAADVFEEFVDRLVAKAAAVQLAVPEPTSGQIGPIIAPRQVAVIEDHLRDAVDKGARVLSGGEVERVDGGAYVRPTVLTEVDHSMRVMTEETFGPLVPVMAFGSPDEAVRLANDTHYGLSAAVFGAEDEAVQLASRLEAGAVSINDASLTALVHDGEKNSFKMSGLGGSRMGAASIRRFVRRQALLVSERTDPDPWWYPHLRG